MSVEKRATRRTAKDPIAPKTSTRAKAREGKKAIVGYYSPEMSQQLQTLAVDQERTMQAMLGDGLNLLFEKHGLPTFEAE
jgi:hypothetical protein